jgi:hypothetical protein
MDFAHGAKTGRHRLLRTVPISQRASALYSTVASSAARQLYSPWR